MLDTVIMCHYTGARAGCFQGEGLIKEPSIAYSVTPQTRINEYRGKALRFGSDGNQFNKTINNKALRLMKSIVAFGCCCTAILPVL